MVKVQLDQVRALTVPTIPGHHALKIVDAVAVEMAEATLATDLSRGDVLGQQLREALVYPHFQPGAHVPVRHIKVEQPPVEIWGDVKRFQVGTWVLARHFHGGGTYDGLGLPKKKLFGMDCAGGEIWQVSSCGERRWRHVSVAW